MTPQSRDMIARLVGYDTVSRHSNLELIHYVRDYLAGHGITSQLIHNDDGTKANLLATVGPQVEGGVVLSGHTDVVPVDGQPWSTDPFQLTEKDGRLYGRGTCDMKAFSAVGLAMVPTLLEKGLKRPVHFALSYDEEIGCLGAPSLIEQLISTVARPEAVIVGEPTSMQPVVAHKGIAVLRTTVRGHEAHSSQMHRGVSAVMVASRLVTFINDMMDENLRGAEPGNPFEPPCTTLHVGTIKGGTAVNIISRDCEFIWDIRCLPGDNWQQYADRLQAFADSLLPEMQAIAPEAGIHTELIASAPPLHDLGGPAQSLVYDLLDHRSASVVPYVAEAGQFQEQGLSVVLCGPGSIDQAHQPDEYIDIDQVTACEAFIDRLGDRLAQ